MRLWGDSGHGKCVSNAALGNAAVGRQLQQTGSLDLTGQLGPRALTLKLVTSRSWLLSKTVSDQSEARGCFIVCNSPCSRC